MSSVGQKSCPRPPAFVVAPVGDPALRRVLLAGAAAADRAGRPAGSVPAGVAVPDSALGLAARHGRPRPDAGHAGRRSRPVGHRRDRADVGRDCSGRRRPGQPDFARPPDLARLRRVDRPGERAPDHQAQRPAVCGDARHAGAHSRRAERLHPGHPQRPGAGRAESAQSVARPAAGLVRHLDRLHRAAGVRPAMRRRLVAGSTPSAATARRLGCRAFRSTVM